MAAEPMNAASVVLKKGGGDIRVSKAYVRGLPPGQDVTAVFFTLANNSGETLVLKSMSSPQAARVELHSMSMDGSVMKMRKVEEYSLADKKVLALKPGGFHVMLVGLTKNLQEGDKVELTLSFDKANMTLDLPVVNVLNETKSH